MISHEFTRREFVKLMAGGSAAMLISFNTGCKSKVSQWRVLDENEISLLDAIAEQIIPTDDFPGGKWANVSNFIDKQLATYYKIHAQAYHEGLKSFRISVEEIGLSDQLVSAVKAPKLKLFEEYSFQEQTVILQKMEKGELQGEYWKANNSAGFFEMLRQHCLQGFYGSPNHGGNKEYISYHMLGLDYPNVIGQNRYDDLRWRTYRLKS
jgi:gluconate 2-dehydrogenase gamma chain